MLNKLSTFYRDKDNNIALAYSKRSLRLADSLNYLPGKALALENTGWILYRMGDYTQSLNLSLQALKTNEQIKDSLAMARCLNNIGAIGVDDEDYEQAIVYLKQAFSISQSLKNWPIATRSLNNLSFAYYRLNRYDSSEYFVNKALETDQSQSFRNAFSYRMLGDLALARKNQTYALSHFEKGLELARKNNNAYLMASLQVRLGNVYIAQKDYARAMELLKKNVLLAELHGYKIELEMSYNSLSIVYAALNDYKTALDYKSKYAELHDSLRAESQRERMASLEALHESEIKEAEIKLLTQQNFLDEQTIKTQSVVGYVYVAGLLVLLTISVFLVRANRKIKHANDALAFKKVEVENQARQLTELNHTKDKIFQLLSHDLHGPVGNVKSVFELLTSGHISQQEFIDMSKDLKATLDNLYLDLINLLHWSKSQLSGIQTQPQEFEPGELIGDLVTRAHELSKIKKLKIISTVEAGLMVFMDRDHFTIMIRNLLSNALKFSNEGGRIWVEAKTNGGSVHIIVKDEGVGLSPEELDKIKNHLYFTRPGTHREKGTGIGLTIINEFMKANSGVIEISSQPGVGSTFTLIFPRSE